MAVKIVLPEGNCVKTSRGTRVFTDSGHEITDITDITIRVGPSNSDIIMATIDVALSCMQNADGISAEFGNMSVEFINKELNKLGYEAIKKK